MKEIVTTRAILTKAMELYGLNKETIKNVVSVKGKLHNWTDVKLLLDLSTELGEVDKQVIVNSCYRMNKIKLLF